MTIDNKIKAVRMYKISPEILNDLVSLQPPQHIVDSLLSKDPSAALEWFGDIMENNKESEKVRISCANILNIIENRIEEATVNYMVDSYKYIVDDFVDKTAESITQYYDNEDYLSPEDNENYKLFKKHKKTIQSWTQDEVTNKFQEFAKNKFPNIYKTGITGVPGIKTEVRDAFYKSIHLYGFYWELSDKSKEKFHNAQEYLIKEADASRREYELSMIESWLAEYKNWLSEMGLHKCTKGSLKDFFKYKTLKVLPTTIDIMKEKF